MATFLETAPTREAAEGVARLLEPIRRRYPGAQVRILPPEMERPCLEGVWRVAVEADGADVETLRQECLDLLGE